MTAAQVEQVEAARAEAADEFGELPSLAQTVVELGLISEPDLSELLAVELDMPFVRLAIRTRLGESQRHQALLWIPFLGDLVLKAAVARFARTLGTLLDSGVQILEALHITKDTASNVHVAAAVDAVRIRVKAGEGIAGPLENTQVFPAMVSRMIEVSEETGKLLVMLQRIADTYEEEVDNEVAALTSILEPLMIVLMSVVVGTIFIALFLPLVRIIQNLS